MQSAASRPSVSQYVPSINVIRAESSAPLKEIGDDRVIRIPDTTHICSRSFNHLVASTIVCTLCRFSTRGLSSRGRRDRKFQANFRDISELPDWPRKLARQLHCACIVYFLFARTHARGGALRGALSRAASDWSVSACTMQDSVHQDASCVEGDVIIAAANCDGCYNVSATRVRVCRFFTWKYREMIFMEHR